MNDLVEKRMDEFVKGIRDMETALMRLFPGSPMSEVILKEEAYNVAERYLKSLNPFLKAYHTEEKKSIKFGSLKLTTWLK